MIEVKVSFDSVGEMLSFFGDKGNKTDKASGVQQVAQVLKDEVQKTLAEPAAPAAQPITPQPQQPITPQPITPQPQPITPQPQQRTYTKDELARACAPLTTQQEGMRMLQELLASYNAISLHDLDKSQYPDFADKLRNLGVSV